MNDLWFFIKKLAEYKKNLFLGLLLTIILTAASISLLTLSGWFIAAAGFAGLTAITASQFNYFLPAGSIRFLALIRIASRYGDRVINHDYTFKILTTLRVWFYQSLIPLTPTHLFTYRSGDLQNQFINDIETLNHLYLRVASPLFIAIITLFGVCFFIHFYSIKLAYYLLIIFILTLTLLPLLTVKISIRAGKQIAIATSELRTHTIDSVQGLTDIILNLPKHQWTQSMEQANARLLRAQAQLAKLKGCILALMTGLSVISILATLSVGMPLIQHKILSGPILAMMILCIIAAFEQITALPLSLIHLGKTTESARRLLKTAKTIPLITFPLQSITPISNHPSITMKNITFHYPNNPLYIFKHFSLQVPFGSTIALTGPSGIGKSTLLQLIARIWDPNNGDIMLDRAALTSISDNDLRNNVTLVTQRVHIFNNSIRDNLTLMNEAITDDKIMETLYIFDLDTLIVNLPNGLNTQMGEFGKHFSGGQIRRFALARALLHDAPIQLWDEPTTGLNDDLIEKMWGRLTQTLQNKTVIIATHHPLLLKKIKQKIDLSAYQT